MKRISTYRELSSPWKMILSIGLSLGCLLSIGWTAGPSDGSDSAVKRFYYSDQDYLSYETLGDGSVPLLFIHGFGTSARTWDKVLQYLDLEGFRCYLVNLKGCGGSSTPHDDAYSILDQARILMRFAGEVIREDPVLVGHSMGAGIALVLATLASTDQTLGIRSLVLLSPAAFSDDSPSYVELLRRPFLGWLLVHSLRPETLVRVTFRDVFHDDDRLSQQLIDAYTSAMVASDYRYSLRATARNILPASFESIIQQYRLIDARCLTIWGSSDEIVGLDGKERLETLLPNITTAVFADCGHNPQDELPEETARLIRIFLNEEKEIESCGS